MSFVEECSNSELRGDSGCLGRAVDIIPMFASCPCNLENLRVVVVDVLSDFYVIRGGNLALHED